MRKIIAVFMGLGLALILLCALVIVASAALFYFSPSKASLALTIMTYIIDPAGILFGVGGIAIAVWMTVRNLKTPASGGKKENRG